MFSWSMLLYLKFFARLSLAINKPTIIGITGSVGKSSARNVIFAVLKDQFKVKMIKEGNSETGIPLGILAISPGSYRLLDWVRILITAPFKVFDLKDIKLLVVEMGVDSPYPPKNMEYLLSIVKPDIAVVLNAYPVHAEQFDPTVPEQLSGQSRIDAITKNIAEEKAKIITLAEPKIGIFNGADENLKKIIVGRPYKATKLLNFGKREKSDVYFGDYKVDLKKTSFELIIPSCSSKKVNIDINGYFLPKKYQEIISAGILVGLSLGLTIPEIKKGLSENFFLPSGRSSFFQGVNDSVIIDSSYNASRAPLFTFIEAVSRLGKQEKRPFIAILGDMRELGKEARQEHEAVAGLLNEVSVDKLYCVGPLTKKYIIPLVKNSQWFENSVELGQYLKTRLPHRAVVLVKGSQNTIFLEETVKFILKNKKDENKLCRQSSFWKDKKRYLYP